ncbi:hypothetical protein QVM48_16765 [Pseudomonas soli]|jgi:Skp family chaperone for outer membrane proteins|uniref:Uncharacterized protein n=1 Tax=Pseudomonas soli TaxID=1306993 RepID=A0ABU7GRA3_9PSED|nr:hypothetical protein [Pseudomonas soli]MDT3716218.1 hypothetical protein [Pseudomonas soli]MDT3732086.1 hypothetical protein [Pseudomonas soli]MEE1881538.1 hypothetical protein [Pseudomonas soli]
MRDHIAIENLDKALQDIANKAVNGKVPPELNTVVQAFRAVTNNMERRIQNLERALNDAEIKIPF